MSRKSPGELTVLELVDLVGTTINSAQPDRPIEMRGTDRPIFEMYGRSHRLFRGIAALIAAGSYDSAMIVGRSLFEQTLRLMEIADAGGGRDRIVLGWAHRGLNDDRRLVRVAEELGHTDNAEVLRAAIERRQREVDQLKVQLRIGKLPKPEQEKPLAKRLGLNDDYWTYEYMHQVVHGTPISLREFLHSGDAGDDFAVHITVEKPGEMLYLAALSSKLMLHSHMATATVLGWSSSAAIPETLAFAQEVLDRLALASEGS